MTATPAAGVIENVPLLDLTDLSTPDDLDAISQLRKVALVLVPASLAGRLHRIPMTSVASVVSVPDGARARVHTGSHVIGGDALAPSDGDNLVLVVTGTLMLSSPVDRITYREVIVTGMVLAPEGSEAAVGAGLTRVTGSVQYYRYAEGQRFKTLSGQIRLGPDTLANDAGTPDDLLILSGQVLVTGPVPRVGFQRIIAAGQILVPRDSEAELAPALSADGQVVWYAGHPRVFVGGETFGRGFFELLDEPLALLLVGSFEIEHDVPPELIRDRVTEITLVGRIRAPREVVPVLQLLTTEKHGTITADRDAGADG